ncbi:MAG: cupin domain-containing protein [Gammaproteobacteria bacterium]|nr:cupin domain-containing protein [Gammaproteobacteria bacterium]
MEKQHHTHYHDIPSYETRDGSEIRELMHPQHHAVNHQSLAEAIVRPGCETRLHLHHRSEELYYITQGEGQMTLGEEHFCVSKGDTVSILPAMPHCIANIGQEDLHILCCCSPAYSHDDTQLLD